MSASPEQADRVVAATAKQAVSSAVRVWCLNYLCEGLFVILSVASCCSCSRAVRSVADSHPQKATPSPKPPRAAPPKAAPKDGNSFNILVFWDNRIRVEFAQGLGAARSLRVRCINDRSGGISSSFVRIQKPFIQRAVTPPPPNANKTHQHTHAYAYTNTNIHAHTEAASRLPSPLPRPWQQRQLVLRWLWLPWLWPLHVRLSASASVQARPSRPPGTSA